MEKQGHIPRIQHWVKKLGVETAAVAELDKELKTKKKYLEVRDFKDCTGLASF